MVHVVDHSDHLEHGDRSISKLHFLTLTPAQYGRIRWLLRHEGESRLRHSDYPPLFERAGYRVLQATPEVHEPTRLQLATLPLVSPWRERPPEDLAALQSTYVLAPGSRP